MPIDWKGAAMVCDIRYGFTNLLSMWPEGNSGCNVTPVAALPQDSLQIAICGQARARQQ